MDRAGAVRDTSSGSASGLLVWPKPRNIPHGSRSMVHDNTLEWENGWELRVAVIGSGVVANTRE
jgi:hypothetical protein